MTLPYNQVVEAQTLPKTSDLLQYIVVFRRYDTEGRNDLAFIPGRVSENLDAVYHQRQERYSIDVIDTKSNKIASSTELRRDGQWLTPNPYRWPNQYRNLADSSVWQRGSFWTGCIVHRNGNNFYLFACRKSFINISSAISCIPRSIYIPFTVNDDLTITLSNPVEFDAKHPWILPYRDLSVLEAEFRVYNPSRRFTYGGLLSYQLAFGPDDSGKYLHANDRKDQFDIIVALRNSTGSAQTDRTIDPNYSNFLLTQFFQGYMEENSNYFSVHNGRIYHDSARLHGAYANLNGNAVSWQTIKDSEAGAIQPDNTPIYERFETGDGNSYILAGSGIELSALYAGDADSSPGGSAKSPSDNILLYSVNSNGSQGNLIQSFGFKQVGFHYQVGIALKGQTIEDCVFIRTLLYKDGSPSDYENATQLRYQLFNTRGGFGGALLIDLPNSIIRSMRGQDIYTGRIADRTLDLVAFEEDDFPNNLGEIYLLREWGGPDSGPSAPYILRRGPNWNKGIHMAQFFSANKIGAVIGDPKFESVFVKRIGRRQRIENNEAPVSISNVPPGVLDEVIIYRASKEFITSETPTFIYDNKTYAITNYSNLGTDYYSALVEEI